jgi:hypothetical protein
MGSHHWVPKTYQEVYTLALHLEPVNKVKEEIREKGGKKKKAKPRVCFKSAKTKANYIHSIFRANERIT